MAVFGQLDNVTGRLTNIRIAETATLPGDVLLVSMPSGFGPFGYDALNQVAIALPAASQTDDERLSSLSLTTKVLAALAVRASSTFASQPAGIKNKVQGIIDNASAAIVAALS